MTRMSVTDRANAIGTFRFIAVRLMETLARWTPMTPEMEVKILFGRHIWDFAQHADALGKRTFELRQPEQWSRAPAASYLSLLDQIAAATTTAERLGSLYDGLLPALEQRYRDYIAAADPILDEPSVLIMERILGDLQRQRAEASAVRRELSIGEWNDPGLAGAERQIASIVG